MKSFKRDKVLIYAHHVPPQPSASATRMLSLARFLREQGISIDFITTKPGPSYHDGFSIIRCKGRVELLRSLSNYARCPILVSSPPGTPAAEVAAVARVLGYRVVVDIRDPFVSEALKTGDLAPGLSTSVKLWLERSLLSSAHVLSYVSVALQELTEKRFGRPRCAHVIAPNGVDRSTFNFSEKFRIECRKALNFGEEAVFVYVGILGGKSLDKAFTALAPALRKGAKLLMIAVLDEFSKDIFDSLQKLALELGISDKITWCFNLNQEEVAFHLNGADIGINPLPFNRSYCMPVKTFEFLACGVYPLNVVANDSALLSMFKGNALGTFSFSWDDCSRIACELMERVNDLRILANERSESAALFDRKDANRALAAALMGTR
jgi:glycosyltransferase involved in cell wall biosynthesis